MPQPGKRIGRYQTKHKKVQGLTWIFLGVGAICL
nr:MAG TPA: hypothetical protein [Caudoviricetes sp.]